MIHELFPDFVAHNWQAIQVGTVALFGFFISRFWRFRAAAWFWMLIVSALLIHEVFWYAIVHFVLGSRVFVGNLWWVPFVVLEVIPFRLAVTYMSNRPKHHRPQT